MRRKKKKIRKKKQDRASLPATPEAWCSIYATLDSMPTLFASSASQGQECKTRTRSGAIKDCKTSRSKERETHTRAESTKNSKDPTNSALLINFPTELRCRNVANNDRLSMQIGANRMQKRACNVYCMYTFQLSRCWLGRTILVLLRSARNVSPTFFPRCVCAFFFFFLFFSSFLLLLSTSPFVCLLVLIPNSQKKREEEEE